MSWHCSQALAAEFSERGCLDSASCAELSSTRTAEKSCYGDKKKVSSTRSPSGMTSEPSTASRGVAKWISSLADSRVNRGVSLANGKDRQTNATSGLIPFASLEKSPQDGVYWKTSQGCFTTIISDEFSQTWPRAGIVLDGTAYPLPPLVPRTVGIGCGSSLYPTPAAAEGVGRWQSEKALAHGWKETLAGMALRGMWPTPNQRDWKDTGDLSNVPTNSLLPREVQSHGGSKTQRRWATPRAGDWRNMKHDQWTKNLQKDVKGQLNPYWVEWLMGWPLGWTVLEPLLKEEFDGWQKYAMDWCERGTTDVPLRQMCCMWSDKDPAETPPQWRQKRQSQRECGGSMSDTPYVRTYESEDMGQGQNTQRQSMSSLQRDISPTESKAGSMRKNPMSKRMEQTSGTQALVPRIATGIPYRVDRLKALGNGQVPAVVRAAWEWLI